MRFNVQLSLENEIIPKDKNRIFISFLKHNFSSYSKEYYRKQYEEEKNKSKNFTFSLYMGNCKFSRDEIIIPGKKIILNFSTSDVEDGIVFYNSILENKSKEFPIKGNNLKIKRISLNKERVIVEDKAKFKTLSPISIRKHNGSNKETWYYSLEEQEGQKVFLENLSYQLFNVFGENNKKDIEEIEFELLGNKEVKVKNYGIEVLSNISTFNLKAKPYILDYIYKAGIGSQRNSGFGMLDLV